MTISSLQSVRIDLAVEKATILSCSSAQIISGVMTGDNTMKRINISTPTHPNSFTLVDDEDFKMLSMFGWKFAKRTATKAYVIRNAKIDGK